MVKILYNNKIITRKIRAEQMGNFQMNIVRIKNNDYLLGSGAEYLQGYDDVYDFKDLKPISRKIGYKQSKLYRFGNDEIFKKQLKKGD